MRTRLVTQEVGDTHISWRPLVLIGSRTENSVISANLDAPKREVRFGLSTDIASVLWHVNKCQLAFFAGHLSIRATSVYVPSAMHIRHTIAGEALVLNRAAQS